MSLICPKCEKGLMKWKIRNTLMICDKCGYEATIRLWKEDWNKQSSQNLAKPDAYSLLAEVRALLENIVEGEYRIFHSDSMDQDTILEEDIRSLYKKVSKHFS